jgi:hypothetical protein
MHATVIIILLLEDDLRHINCSFITTLTVELQVLHEDFNMMEFKYISLP